MSDDNDLWPRIRMGLREPAKAANGIVPTCDEMRTAIMIGSRDSVLIRQCLDAARMTGMSGEDTYVLLAYQALLQLESTHRRVTELCTLLPTVPLAKR